MRFWDSSALVPLLVVEPESTAVQRLYDEDGSVFAWWGTEVECVSAIARRERAGAPRGRIADAYARLGDLVVRWQEIEPSETLRKSAARLLRVHDLRAGDSLQLAAALSSAASPESLPFVTLDERLRLAAEREGFSVLP
jgi:predicted nucleic acid-binding protein